MSIMKDQMPDAIIQMSTHECPSTINDLATDSSSCLSEIEDKEIDGKLNVTKGLEESCDGMGNMSGDSEAETERLERSPSKYHINQYVDSDLINTHKLAQVNSPAHTQAPDGDFPVSDEDNLVEEPPDYPKRSTPDSVEETSIESPLAEESAGKSNNPTYAGSAETRKRKRSVMDGTGLNDLDEPSRKRTGSSINPDESYPFAVSIKNVNGNFNSIALNISVEGENVPVDDPAKQTEECTISKDEISHKPDSSNGLRKRKCKIKRHNELEIIIRDADPRKSNDQNKAVNDSDDKSGEKNSILKDEEEEEAEEAEIPLRNEEEMEKKKVALHQLIELEKQFSAFRDRLYEERLQQLTCEEAVLRQAHPSHPGYLSMMICIDARREERIRKADKLREYEMESLKKVAVAQRSQILVQYQQEVRNFREKKLEQLGEQWYKIQHDRRSYSGASPEYVLKFPTKKSQQIANHIAYSSEVSILSGIAKYVGFPAAPTMAPATAAELEDDLEKMGRSKYISQAAPVLSMHEIAALRAANSTSRLKLAEEQFVEQTPWAYPQHPLHAHLVNRQLPTSQITRTISPFSQSQMQSRRQSQINEVAPNARLFSNAAALHQLSITADRMSSHDTFSSLNSNPMIPPNVPISISQTGSCKSIRSTTTLVEKSESL